MRTQYVLKAVVIASAISTGTIGFAQQAKSLNSLEPAVRERFEAVRRDLAQVEQQLADLRQKSYTDDPLLQQAVEERPKVAEKLREANERLQKDREARQSDGQTDVALFEHWQSNYGSLAGATSAVERLMTDPESRPYFLKLAQTVLGRLQGAELPSEFETVRDLIPEDRKELTAERTLEIMRAVSGRSQTAELMRSTLPEVEAKLNPTEAERQNVEEAKRLFVLEGLYVSYGSRELPMGIRDLESKAVSLTNDLTSIWPGWQEAEQAAIEATRKEKQEAELRGDNPGHGWWLLGLNVGVLGIIALLFFLRRRRT